MFLKILKFSLPVSAMYLGLMLMGLVDLIMVTKLGLSELGGLSLGNSVLSWVMVALIGLMNGVDFPMSKAVGEKNYQKAHAVYSSANKIALYSSLPICLFFFFFADQLISFFGYDKSVAPFAIFYIKALIFSLPFASLFHVQRSALQSRGYSNITFYVLIISNLLNYFLNRGFIFGEFYFPKLGFSGSPLATFISRGVMCFLLFLFYKKIVKKEVFIREEKIDIAYKKESSQEILKLGIPSCLHMTFEVGVFSLSTLLAGKFSVEALAAHQMVLNVASFSFMIPLGMSVAVSTEMGNAYGQKDFKLVSALGWKTILYGCATMTCMGIFLIAFPSYILDLFNPTEAVFATAKSLLLIAALFQISDATQAIGSGVLRGVGNTKSSAIGNLVGHWFIGLPIGVYLGFYLHKGIHGVWVGLSIGLTCVAVYLTATWRKESQKLLHKIV